MILLIQLSANGEFTGFCLKELANDKAMSFGKANKDAIVGSGKIPCEAACALYIIKTDN